MSDIMLRWRRLPETTFVVVAIGNINPPRSTWALPQLYLAAVSPCLEMVFKKEQTEPTQHLQLDSVSPEIFGFFVE